MRRAVELADIHYVALVFQNSSFVVVYVQVIGRGEDSHDRGETCRLRFAVHPVTERHNLKFYIN